MEIALNYFACIIFELVGVVIIFGHEIDDIHSHAWAERECMDRVIHYVELMSHVLNAASSFPFYYVQRIMKS